MNDQTFVYTEGPVSTAGLELPSVNIEIDGGMVMLEVTCPIGALNGVLYGVMNSTEALAKGLNPAEKT